MSTLLEKCTRKRIPFSLDLAQALADAVLAPVPAAVLVCYIADLQEVDGDQGYVYKTLQQISVETGLRPGAVKTAKTVLQALRILLVHEKGKGYRIDSEKLESFMTWHRTFRASASKEV